MDYLSLCLICKDENDYLSEWLDYHILMGVDRFYIYDNESRVSLRESLKEYIERGWAMVVDIHGKAVQLHAYDHCLQTFGAQTFWLGFIDTDEFLVPKSTQDLKELLREYEQYAGLAVSSLFFGSGGLVARPVEGQISGYTWRTHETFKENELVKSIVQPGLTLMPNSPHDFTYKEGAWCVNEGFLRVDYQRFPNCTAKIQLNHYYCRSEKEIDEKLRRGNSGDITWPRRLFDTVNSNATIQDTYILQNLEKLPLQARHDPSSQQEIPSIPGLLENMSNMARTRHSRTPGLLPPVHEVQSLRVELLSMEELKTKTQAAMARKEFEEAKRLVLLMLEKTPQNIIFYDVLAGVYSDLGDSAAAWQTLTCAWQLSPNNNYVILRAMAFYFLRTENFSMTENSCRLLLELTPHDLVPMGLLTCSLIGQKRYEEAAEIGIPVVELSTGASVLPNGMGIYIVKKLADYLREKGDYAGAVRLWEAGLKYQPEDVNVLLELSQALLLAGDTSNAHLQLTQAQKLAPQNETVLAALKKIGTDVRGTAGDATPRSNKKRKK